MVFGKPDDLGRRQTLRWRTYAKQTGAYGGHLALFGRSP
jgi:hypothetical protein